MTYKEVYQLVSSIEIEDGVNVPAAYRQFPEGDPQNPAPSPPFICYYFSDSYDFIADNTNYQRIRLLDVELYTDNKDFALEEAVEAALNAHGLVYSREETYIDSEQMYMVVFTTNVAITDEEEGEQNA